LTLKILYIYWNVRMNEGKRWKLLVDLTLGSYGVTSLVAGIINAILDPLGTTGATINLSNLFKGISSDVSKTLGISKTPVASSVAGKFVG
jgi:hypothetical protein